MSEDAAQERPYDAQFLPSEALRDAFADFVAVVRHLRRDCPWDREQTHASVKHLTLEEAYEAVDAIDAEDWDELEGELGDVLLHVAFHSRIAEQEGRFTLEGVIQRETRKLIRRHPYVFGEAVAGSTEEVEQTWEAVKRAERDGEAPASEEDAPSALDGVPEALPALLKAERVQQKAAGTGFDFATRAASWDKVEEELREFREATEGAPREASQEKREEELGDVLFALTTYARREGLGAENALRGATATFARRFRRVEQQMAEHEDGATLEDMEQWWNEAKAEERMNGGAGQDRRGNSSSRSLRT